MANNVSYSRIPSDISERWKIVRDVIAGDQAMRAYIPMLNSLDRTPENLARNNSYRSRAVWYPATSFTLEGLLGLAFRVDPQTNLPNYLDYLLTDADGQGNSLYQQSQSAVSNNLQVGRHGLFVDFSEELQHPVIKEYLAENIINWRYSLVGGALKLTMVVLQEEVEVENEFEVAMVKQWRELRLEGNRCLCRVYRESDNDSPQLQSQRDANGMEVTEVVLRSRARELDFIPFRFIGAQNNDGSKIGPSPLYGLAQVNRSHFLNSADFEDSVFFVGQVQPFITGLDIEWRNYLQNPTDENGQPTGARVYVGSRAPLLLPQGATFGFAQASPNVLVKEAMTHKEEQMIAIGARMIEATRAGKTATGENNDREATTSVLSLCVSNVSEAYQEVISWCGRYMDRELNGDDTYKINQDFIRAATDPAIMRELVNAWQTGVMAKNDVRDYFRRLGVIATERSNEDIEADLEEEGPSSGSIEDPLELAGMGSGGVPPGGFPQAPPGTAQVPPRIPPGNPGAMQ